MFDGKKRIACFPPREYRSGMERIAPMQTARESQKRAESRATKANRSMAMRSFWRAVTSRDAALDGVFVFAVRSTGIYCRPSCPARRPHPRNVQFFVGSEAAERAGFRPCRRCRPQEAPCRAESKLVGRVCRLIEEAEGGAARLADLARACDASPSHLQRTFRRLMGISPRGYAAAVRLRRLKTQLRKGDDVTTALYEAGYGSTSRLYEGSNRQLGMTPATYRRGGRGMEIGYSIASSPLGRLLVAGTARGISAVYLGDADERLEEELHREYPEAKIVKNSAAVSGWVKELVRHLAGKQAKLDLPLDVAATAFQRCVWEHLQDIPHGATRTYSDVARALGRPSATRAVARACATNPVSIVIPCHRVVRGDGSLAGYRWGIERKRALLEQEKRSSRTGKAS
jgi:AraC family transcriptional regulator of adaptative response/methylated-DNA-[protein]-cysteine methyltransferase